MSEQRVSEPTVTTTSGYADNEPSGWVGWVLFAGMMMILLGVFAVIEGCVGIFNHHYYTVSSHSLVVSANYTAWGWTHLILGVLAVTAGFALMAGKLWARIYAVVLVMLNAIVNLAFIAASPVWSIIMITIDTIVIYAVCVHGRELDMDA